MQMDAEFQEEQIGTLCVWVGALGGGSGGVCGPSGETRLLIIKTRTTL